MEMMLLYICLQKLRSVMIVRSFSQSVIGMGSVFSFGDDTGLYSLDKGFFRC